jgi:hypothetical protein
MSERFDRQAAQDQKEVEDYPARDDPAQSLQHELAATNAPAPLIHPNLAEVHRQRVAQLHDALQDQSTRDEAFTLIRSLIDEIQLMPENGELRIELRGALAGILGLAADNKKPGGLTAAGLAEQIKMVAGARNQRCLQALRARIPMLPRPLTAATPVRIR